ncbi:Acyl-CoA N-acyltransferase [Metarhizium album ARSEF 1941]|uniref:Acyl-CoA N-acyltransferase n=1 Tax=Metarhizium album (strain ARSEF 1941) TaxID=1081103 RepID=A0A0B2WWR6_METAS|nr:Acyl-CoA N-acyltransferase [Metarhizium album ARSEF 1941]KHN98054.1 Acyl-CoA N-acyltransferase [Metarhizium album ARSEF 1941]
MQAHHLCTRIESRTLPLALRTIEPRDAPRHAAILTADAGASDPSAAGVSASRSEELIAGQRESAAVPTVLGPDGAVASGPARVNMVLVLKAPEGEKVIGLGGFGAIEDRERNGARIRAGDAGVVIDEAYRGNGYAVEAMKMAMAWAFTPVADGGPQLDIVSVTTTATNKPMLALAEDKLGLKGKGVLRHHEFGHAAGEMYYELTAEDWSHMNKKS